MSASTHPLLANATRDPAAANRLKHLALDLDRLPGAPEILRIVGRAQP